jgi:hypothetical protein
MTAQIEPPAPVAFDYATIPPADRSWLRDRTAAVKLTSRSIAAEVTAIGMTLAAVKERIGHGRFQQWCAAELPWSMRQTQRLMQVGKIFGDLAEKRHCVAFEPTALFLLAQPSTPQGAREYALELASGGQKVSASVAKEIVNGWRRVPVMSKSEVREAAPDRPEDRKPLPPSPPAGPWEALAASLSDASYLHISRVFVAEEEGPVFSVTLSSEGQTRFEMGSDLAGVMKRLAGMERKRTCPRCMVAKPIPQFSRNADMPDGVNRYCKQCERKRIAKWKGKKKGRGGDTPAA